MDELDGADIDAARRLADQQHLGLARDLARQHQLLLVAAGEVRRSAAPGARGRTSKRSISVAQCAADGRPVEQVVRQNGAGPRDSRGRRLPGLERRHHALAQAVLRHMRQAERRASRPDRWDGRASIIAAAHRERAAGRRGGCRTAPRSSSLWPLPETPAMPTISPARSSRSTSSSSAHAAMRRPAPSCSADSSTSPGFGAALSSSQPHLAADHQLGQLLADRSRRCGGRPPSGPGA